MSTDIKDLLAYATEARLDSEESAAKIEADALHQMSLSFILKMIPYWRRYYLKKNQLENYFRVTQIILPGMFEYPQTWTHKFQVWRPGSYKELVIDERITREAYEWLRCQPNWNPLPDNPDFFVFKNPNKP